MRLLVVDFHHYQNPSKVLRDRVRLRGDGKYGGRNSRWHRKSPYVDLLHDGDGDTDEDGDDGHHNKKDIADQVLPGLHLNEAIHDRCAQ